MAPWFVALRYLSSRFVTFASFLLVSLSVAILIILLGVMEGFRTEMMERIRGTSSDIKVRSTRFVGMGEHPEVRRLLEGAPAVRAVVPYVETLAMYTLEIRPLMFEQTGHLSLAAIDLRAEARAGKLDEYIENAAADSGQPRTVEEILSRRWLEEGLWKVVLRPPPGDLEELRPVLIGAEVFRYLNVIRGFPRLHGQVLELQTVSPVTMTPRTGRFVIAGYFRSKDIQQDSATVLIDLDDATEFLELEREPGKSSITGFRVFLDRDAEAAPAKEAILERVAAAGIPFVAAQTWQEEKSKILRAVRMEKAMVGIILGVIILFVGLMVFIIMTVQIVEKTRDLGILQAIGMTPAGVVGIYLRLGGVICLAGIALGVLYGVGFCLSIDVLERWLYVLTGKAIFPPDVYYIDRIPVRLVLSDFAFIIVPTVVVGFLASLLAAVRITRQDPLESLRYE